MCRRYLPGQLGPQMEQWDWLWHSCAVAVAQAVAAGQEVVRQPLIVRGRLAGLQARPEASSNRVELDGLFAPKI